MAPSHPYSNKITKKYLVFCLFLFNFNFSFGQNLKGKVFSLETKTPLKDVNVYLKHDKKIGSYTNSEGEFSLKLNDKINSSDSIFFSCVGFKTHASTLSLLRKDSVVIFLSKKNIALNEVEVDGIKKQGKIRFEKVGDLKTGVYAFASLLRENKIYISGGDKSIHQDTFKKAVEKAGPNASLIEVAMKMEPSTAFKGYSGDLMIYDLDNNTVEQVEEKFDKRAYHSMNLTKGKLYLLGGKRSVNKGQKEFLFDSIEVFDLNKKTRESEDVNPHQAANFSSFIYKNNLITLGGSVKLRKNGIKVFNEKIHALNLSDGLWYEVGEMQSPKETQGVLINDKIYLVGGYNNASVPTIETWDLVTGQWETLGSMFAGLDFPALTFHQDSIYIYHKDKFLIFNIKNMNIREYKISLGIKRPRIHFYKNAIYILGGFVDDEFLTSPSTWVYKVNLDEFDKTKIKRKKKLGESH